MIYKYVSAYQIRGLIHDPEKGDIEIYTEEGESSVRAILTDKLDDYCYDLDRSQSLGPILLKSLVGQRESADLRIEVETEVNRIRDRRKKELEHDQPFVFVAEGKTEADFSKPHQETDDFVIGVGIIDKEKIVAAHNNQINAILSALCLSTEHETIQVKLIRGDVYLINESGKSVYSLNSRYRGRRKGWTEPI